MPERFEIYIVYKRRYINTLPFLFYTELAVSSLAVAETIAGTHWPLRLCTEGWPG